MRLRKWVKVVLSILAIICLISLTKWTNKEIDKCVKGGNTEQFCRQALSK